MTLFLYAMSIGAAGLALFRLADVARKRQRRFNDETLEALTRAVRLRSRRMGVVTDRAVELGRLVGLRCGLGHSQVELIARAASLRDLGLCSVPYQLLNEKSFYDWDQADRDTYRRHLAVTDDLLAGLTAFQPERELLRQSESIYWLHDGTDRPTLPALVLKAACEFALHEAMFGTESAEGRLIAQTGKEFEPGVVRAFVEVLHSDRVRANVPSVV